MLSFEEAQAVLDEIADALPPAIFDGLNGGYALTYETVVDDDGLYILGQYHVEPHGLGRYVTVNYGSVVEVYGHLNPRRFRDKLKKILHHELTHHLESLAGDRSLEVQDSLDRARYRGLNTTE
jgi:hypothetical protein